MLDFVQIIEKEKNGRGKDAPTVIEVRPDFIVGRVKDLMVQGGAFYAVWNEETMLWSRDEYDVALLVDAEIKKHVEKLREKGIECEPKYLRQFANGGWKQFRTYVKNVSDNSHPLDAKVTFRSAKTKKSDYASRRLSYDLAPGDISAYEELVGVLYDPEEREKFEWALGAILLGVAKNIQKFLVFYGKGGTGKSTIMDLAFQLLGGRVPDGGYVAMFDAKSLVGNNSAFSTEAFKDNPLLAIQQDGDLSRIEDNTKLNSIVSHEAMRVNEKYKATYDTQVNAMLFMGTNKVVRISDAKSGLIRRLIDVNPTTVTHPPERYYQLIEQVGFELGAIAHHCVEVYKDGGRNRYSNYRPMRMMLKTDIYLNYIETYYHIFKQQDGTTLSHAWTLWQEYVKDAEIEFKVPRHVFREELKNYFNDYYDRKPSDDGSHPRNVYTGFNVNPFKTPIETPEGEPPEYTLVLQESESLLDEMYAGLLAQYPNSKGTPKLYWNDDERTIRGVVRQPTPDEIASTTLGELDTGKLHYVKVPEHHIVIDFDLEGEDGEKSLELNLKAASIFPQTYAELSKSGNGVHLHYIYDGDPSELSSKYSEGIEIKVYSGNSSLRRKLTWCNKVPVATIKDGLPFKENKVGYSKTAMQTEEGLRALISKNLRKEIHPGTKPSMDFIEHILKQANEKGVVYDVEDMWQKIYVFANNSEKNSDYCRKVLGRLKLKSDVSFEETNEPDVPFTTLEEHRIVFFDCEVYPNLFVICWKFHGSPKDSVVQMINPTPAEVEKLMGYKLVGFNNRSYDNHIMWARMRGANEAELYDLSQRIIVKKDQNAKFGQAYGMSYADVYDFSVKKQGLKPWEIELGIPHVEMDIPWDKPVPKEKILQVVDYCCNDVNALEAVFDHLKQDFLARQILGGLSGLSVNSPTRAHAIKIMFGEERKPQSSFVYTDLSEQFPGYKFDPYSKKEKSTYRGYTVGEGGFVFGKPGMYSNVALLDVTSMHPTSIEELNLFGKYTANFSRIKEARVALADGDYGRAKSMLPDLPDSMTDVEIKALSDGLKLVINSVYGYTSAKFDNPFRDPRNVDNIVAKRGALFMIDLLEAVKEQGFEVAHIKTDSIKIPDATPDIIAFVQEFGAQYGYTFKLEATYDRMCLVNNAVYVAYVNEDVDKKGKTVPAHWTATGAEFQHPYVFKTLFTGDAIRWRDLGEKKQVKEGAMYLRYENGMKPVGILEDEKDSHVGRTGLFVPVKPGNNQGIIGAQLLRIKDDREYAVTGTKGYLWAEEDMVRQLKGDMIDRLIFERLEDAEENTGALSDVIDMAYYSQLAENAAQSIAKWGDYKSFIDVDMDIIPLEIGEEIVDVLSVQELYGTAA